MDTMDRYKIEASIEDVIAILDSAPIHRDMIPETNTVQLTNRMPIAHLAIERGLKALIAEAGETPKEIHGLQKLYRVLGECDKESADYLARAFEDAVNFFGYNVNVKGFRQFRSLDNYLSKVGTEKAFEELRYWAIGESSKGESPIPYISPPIHRELLCALWCLFLPDHRETVSQRVERKVADAMGDGRHIVYSSNDTRKEHSVLWYFNWLAGEHSTRRSALEEAVQREFVIKDEDEFVSQTLRDAYKDLRQSNDPAVRYYIGTLTYLPKDSQPRHPDAVPKVKWLNAEETKGMVETPGGIPLGFIEKYADGGWGITPAEEGLVQVTDIARTLADAKHYLVHRITRQVAVTVEGRSKQLRIVSRRDFFQRSARIADVGDSIDLIPDTQTYVLEFWNGEHGLHPGETISVELQPNMNREFAYVLEGTVVTVAEHKVSINGTETLR